MENPGTCPSCGGPLDANAWMGQRVCAARGSSCGNGKGFVLDRPSLIAGLQEIAKAPSSYSADHLRFALEQAVAHLQAAPPVVERTASKRGFTQYEPVDCGYGGILRVFESSSAFDPSLWLGVRAAADDPNQVAIARANGQPYQLETAEETFLLRAWQARLLRDTLDAALREHFDGDVSRYNPDREPEEAAGLHD